MRGEKVLPDPPEPTHLLHLHLMPRLMEQESEEGDVLVIEMGKLATIDVDPAR